MKILGKDFPNPYICDLYFQPFKRGNSYQTSEGRNVWGWDGNKEVPTLSPSWLIEWANPKEFRVHLFFQNGKINLLSDSTVTLEE